MVIINRFELKTFNKYFHPRNKEALFIFLAGEANK